MTQLLELSNVNAFELVSKYFSRDDLSETIKDLDQTKVLVALERLLLTRSESQIRVAIEEKTLEVTPELSVARLIYNQLTVSTEVQGSIEDIPMFASVTRRTNGYVEHIIVTWYNKPINEEAFKKALKDRVKNSSYVVYDLATGKNSLTITPSNYYQPFPDEVYTQMIKDLFPKATIFDRTDYYKTND